MGAKSPKDIFTDVGFILKLIAWILLIVNVVMICSEKLVVVLQDMHELNTIVIACGGCLTFVTCFLIAFILEETTPFVEIFIFLTSGVLNLAAGIIVVIRYTELYENARTDETIIYGALALVIAAIFIIDQIIFSILKKDKPKM